jgi:hypothetical protein
MIRVALIAIVLASAVSATATSSAKAPEQEQGSSIVGTWILTAAEKLLPDGTRLPDYGANPHGLVIFTADGFYSVQIYRADRVKFASGDKFTATAEEYKDASIGMSVHFGRYRVDPVKHTIAFEIDRSSVPNIDDTTAVRAFELKGDELSWKVAPRQDGSIPMTRLRRYSARSATIGSTAVARSAGR